MDNQSGPPLTVSDTITAIILSMQALGLDIFLSGEFRVEDVHAVMARVDAIVQQQRAGHINLEYGLAATTFQQQCDVVLKKRRAEEAQEEAETVAGYGALERKCTNPGDCQCEEDEEKLEEIIAIGESDAEIEAAKAYIADEDAIFAHDVEVGEAVAEALALDDKLAFGESEYPYTDYRDIYGCSCEDRFGLDDDGEVRHYDCY